MSGAAVVLALASASCFGLALTLTQFWLRDATPSAGAAISIPTSTLLFVLAAPVGLAGSSPQWAAVPVFAGVGLLFPAAVTLITFEANRRLGPVIAGSLGNLAPVFAVLLAFFLLGEPLRVGQILGLAVILAGIAALTAPRGNQVTGWKSWYVVLPLAAVLIGYVVSSAVVVMTLRRRSGRWRPAVPRRAAAWFAGVGLCNGLAVLLMYAALARGPVSLVSPLVATYPLVTVIASALVLQAIDNQIRIAMGAALTVAGVGLLLVA